MFQVANKLLDQVYLLSCPHFMDVRGTFTKIFHHEHFSGLGLDFFPEESFITTSSENVLRGMHYQVCEAAHSKLVYCISGAVLDVVVDIRPDSSEYNKPVCVNLSADQPTAVYIGKGYAHGFIALVNNSSLFYSTSVIHCPELDRGILWSSIDFNWPVSSPILSERDKNHPSISSLI